MAQDKWKDQTNFKRFIHFRMKTIIKWKAEKFLPFCREQQKELEG